jgi:hypothetical protein
MVAYDARAGVCGPCHWCGVGLDWPSAHVDHLNDSKDDNSPDNLVVSCPECNKMRGMLLSFIGTLLPERVGDVLAQVNARLLAAARRETSEHHREASAS